MSNLQMIEELCGISESLLHIVLEQRKVLAQHNALFMEEETARTHDRYIALLGHDEWPDALEGGETDVR